MKKYIFRVVLFEYENYIKYLIRSGIQYILFYNVLTSCIDMK